MYVTSAAEFLIVFNLNLKTKGMWKIFLLNNFIVWWDTFHFAENLVLL